MVMSNQELIEQGGSENRRIWYMIGARALASPHDLA